MLREIIRDAMARSLAQYQDTPAEWEGADWWQLSTDESAVFELGPGRWAEMLPVWQAFDFFRGRTNGWNNADLERDYPDLGAAMQAAREQHPEWLQSDEYEVFAHFAKHYASLSHREAYAVFWKMHFWEVRTGVKWFADELG